MLSLALFPCSYTDGARVLGEISNGLQLPVYTDQMLLNDMSAQFGVATEQLEKILFGVIPSMHPYPLKKVHYTHLLKYALNARLRSHPFNCLFYGLHSALFDRQSHNVLKVLVFDEIEGRMQRAILQEKLQPSSAEKTIRDHDEKVSLWTRFLFRKEAYDRSLYDIVIPCGGRNLLDVTGEITYHYDDRYRQERQEIESVGTFVHSPESSQSQAA